MVLGIWKWHNNRCFKKKKKNVFYILMLIIHGTDVSEIKKCISNSKSFVRLCVITENILSEREKDSERERESGNILFIQTYFLYRKFSVSIVTVVHSGIYNLVFI